jgi:hypothetical protein
MNEDPKSQDEGDENEHEPGIIDVASIFFHQGAMALGAAPHPATGKPFVSFEMVQEMITYLEILQEKTTGNLSDEESHVLTTMVDQLKMAYVQSIRDPKIRELMEKSKAEGEPGAPSLIVTPDGRPASAVKETPRIIIP